MYAAINNVLIYDRLYLLPNSRGVQHTVGGMKFQNRLQAGSGWIRGLLAAAESIFVVATFGSGPDCVASS